MAIGPVCLPLIFSLRKTTKIKYHEPNVLLIIILLLIFIIIIVMVIVIVLYIIINHKLSILIIVKLIRKIIILTLSIIVLIVRITRVLQITKVTVIVQTHVYTHTNKRLTHKHKVAVMDDDRQVYFGLLVYVVCNLCVVPLTAAVAVGFVTFNVVDMCVGDF